MKTLLGIVATILLLLLLTPIILLLALFGLTDPFREEDI